VTRLASDIALVKSTPCFDLRFHLPVERLEHRGRQMALAVLEYTL
jgi:hypothetical protein